MVLDNGELGEVRSQLAYSNVGVRSVDRIVQLLICSGNANPEIRVSDIWKKVKGFLEVSKRFDRLPNSQVAVSLRIKIN